MDPLLRGAVGMKPMLIDAHTHVFPPRFKEIRDDLLLRDPTFRELYTNPKSAMATADDLLVSMDNASVDVAVAVGIGWLDAGLAGEANDYLMKQVTCHAGRLIGFCSVSPMWEKRAVEEEVERCVKGGLIGIGEIHADPQGFRIDDKATMDPVMGLASEYKIPVLVHGSEPVGHSYPGKGHSTPDALLRFVESYPDVDIILAHWGGGLPLYALMPEVASALNNVYFDSAASVRLFSPKIYETVVSVLGSERVLFASDYPVVAQSAALDHFMLSDLMSTNRAQILGMNASMLFKLQDKS